MMAKGTGQSRGIRVEPASRDNVSDLDALFATDGIVDRCWCMWNIMRVVDFHAAGREGNRAAFHSMLDASQEPLGVMAHDGDTAVGWCAVGPRSRYVRTLRTPTMRGSDPSEDDAVWLVTCFFVAPGHQKTGVGGALLEGAVATAAAHGATAVEGFPDATGKRSDRGARGREALFEASGFSAVRRPSNARVIMRREL